MNPDRFVHQDIPSPTPPPPPARLHTSLPGHSLWISSSAHSPSFPSPSAPSSLSPASPSAPSSPFPGAASPSSSAPSHLDPLPSCRSCGRENDDLLFKMFVVKFDLSESKTQGLTCRTCLSCFSLHSRNTSRDKVWLVYHEILRFSDRCSRSWCRYSHSPVSCLRMDL